MKSTKSQIPNPKPQGEFKFKKNGRGNHRSLWSLVIGISLVLGAWNLVLLPCAFAQGSLTPPASPGPTMKSLDQVEPRIPIDTTHTAGDSSYTFIISQPGSYYFTGNITGQMGKTGIRIADGTNGVTIDLCGYVLDGNSIGASAIFASLNVSNVIIRNGTIRSWAAGGINLGSSTNGCILENLIVSGNTGTGTVIGSHAVVTNCIFSNNTNGGLSTAGDSTIDKCVANGNGGSGKYGIAAGSASTIANCTAYQNNGANGGGILTGQVCTVINCTADVNNGTNGVGIAAAPNGNNFAGVSVIHCTVTGSGGNGIMASDDCQIVDCNVSGNSGYGISVTDSCLVLSNECANNNGGHILVTGDANRIEANTVSHCPAKGIVVTGSANLIIRNTARANSMNNYDIAANNRYGPIVDLTASGTAAASGNSAASTAVTTDPWANFAY